jgi:O-antigen ligase
MQASVPHRKRHALFFAAVAIALAGAIASLTITALAGTKTGLVLGLSCVAGPILAYTAIVAPLVFPFSLFAVAVPFDNLLDIAAFGTATKGLAMLSGFAIVVYLVRTRRLVRPSPALFFWCALTLWMVTTAFWAMDQQALFKLLPTSLQLLSLYAAISLLPTDRRVVRWVAVATVAGGILAACYGTYLFHNGMYVSKSDRLWISIDPTTGIDPNHFGAALLLPIALCASVFVSARKPLAVLGAAIPLLFLLLGVAESGSRGAVLGIFAIFVYIFWRSRQRLRLLLLAVPLFVAAAAMSASTSIWQRFSESATTGGSNRIPIWHIGLVALKSHWLLGAGFNNFPFAYDQVFLQTNQMQITNWHRGPHDLLLNTAVELGIFGLALMLGAWIAQFRTTENVPSTDADYPLRIAIEAAVIGTFIAALFLDVMVFKYVWLTFILGVILRNSHVRPPVDARNVSSLR